MKTDAPKTGREVGRGKAPVKGKNYTIYLGNEVVEAFDVIVDQLMAKVAPSAIFTLSERSVIEACVCSVARMLQNEALTPEDFLGEIPRSRRPRLRG